MSEDPIRFDIWVWLVRKPPKEATTWLCERWPDLSWAAAKKQIVQASVRGEPFAVARGLGWAATQALRASLPSWIRQSQIHQEGWAYEELSQFCEAHDFHYAGILGCHVCRGFFAE